MWWGSKMEDYRVERLAECIEMTLWQERVGLTEEELRHKVEGVMLRGFDSLIHQDEYREARDLVGSQIKKSETGCLFYNWR